MRSGSRISITAAGAVSPLGEGAETLWAGLVGGRTAVAPVQRFDTTGLRSHLAAVVPPLGSRSDLPPAVLRRLDKASLYAVHAAAQSLEGAGLDRRERVGVVLGTNSAGSIPVAEFLRAMTRNGPSGAPPILFPYTVANAPASQVALVLGLKGPNLTIAQKEGSSVGALATACRILASGGADACVAGGAEDLSLHLYEAFDRLGVLSRNLRDRGGGPEGSRPFDRTRNGFVSGEGACLLLLENEAAARARDRRPLAYVEAVGETRSPGRPHAFPRDPAPLARAVRLALEDAAIAPEDVDAVFASADSSPALDAVEARALGLAFEGSPPPVCSVRGAIGESGIGGAASCVAACFALREGRLPGTAGLVSLDGDLGLDASALARELPLKRVLVTGFASSGSAGALILAGS